MVVGLLSKTREGVCRCSPHRHKPWTIHLTAQHALAGRTSKISSKSPGLFPYLNRTCCDGTFWVCLNPV